MAATMILSCRPNFTAKLSKNVSCCLFRKHYATEVVRKVQDDVPAMVEPSAEKTSVKYPPVKEEFPEGLWEGVPAKLAWLREAKKEEIAKLTTVPEKIDFLTKKELSCVQFPPFLQVQNCTHFQLEKTKTLLVDGMPEIYKEIDVDEDFVFLKPLIIEAIEIEDDKLNRERTLYKVKKTDDEKWLSSRQLKGIMQTILGYLSGKHRHLLRSQFDEDVEVAAFWDRFGVKRPLLPSTPDPNFIRANDSRFVSSHVVDFQIRTEQPPKQFVSIGNDLCRTVPYLKEGQECYQPSVFQCGRGITKPKILPGFRYGDPCEFVLMSILTTNSPEMKKLRRLTGTETVRQNLVGFGAVSGFISCVAQSHYQGFNSEQDLTYPFTTQVVLSDGQTFNFFPYQLNTQRLWIKDGQNGHGHNVCWHSGEMKLYETIQEGKVQGFNDEVLDLLLRCCLFPVGDRHGIDLRPNLAKDIEEPKDCKQHINFRVVEKKVKEKKYFDVTRKEE